MFGIYGLFDKVRESFTNITLDSNDATAKRAFLQAVSHSADLMYIAKDLELRKIGEFDIHTGLIVPLTVPQLVSYGMEYQNAEE